MKVIVADKISDRGIALLKETGWNIVLTTKETLPGELADADALIVRSATKVTAAILDKAPRLRVVGRAGVGVDNIDLDEATKRGVLVMSTPGGSSVSVAEHTFALLLSLVRQVPKFDAAMREGRWEKSSSGAEIKGKTMGLIGLGRIGSEVADRAQAFEMRLIAYDPFISEAAENRTIPSRKRRRRPSRSAARPPSIRKPPNASVYALTIHCRLGVEKWRPC